MSDVQDRIERLAAEARQRVDAAETQVAWQEGSAHGLREAAAITPSGSPRPTSATPSPSSTGASTTWRGRPPRNQTKNPRRNPHRRP